MAPLSDAQDSNSVVRKTSNFSLLYDLGTDAHSLYSYFTHVATIMIPVLFLEREIAMS